METRSKMAVTLETSQIQSLFREKNVEKRKFMLVKFLKFSKFDEEDDLRSGILLDVYHECLSFAVEQGLPWSQVAVFFKIVQQLLQYIADKSLPEVIQLLKHDFQMCSCFSEASLKSLVDYVFTTFLQHYKLYRYVLTEDRVEDRTKYDLTIEPPLELPCFSESVPKAEWDEKERLKEIDRMEETKKTERRAHYQTLLEEASKHLEIPIEKLSTSEEPINRETLTQLIRDIASARAAVTETLLQETLDDMKDKLEHQQLRSTATAECESIEKPTRKKSGSSSGKAKKHK